jgi:hypothetical protein
VRKWIRLQCVRLFEALRPKLDQGATIDVLKGELRSVYQELVAATDAARDEYMEGVAELREARSMMGSGPWVIGPEAASSADAILKKAYESYRPGVALRENAITQQGAFGEIDLMLENIGWRREASLSWMEFSRWGIQQIILISRLYYIKNPLIRRGIDVSASYVFGRGVEVSSDNQSANDVLKRFFENNQKVLGQIALTELEKRKYYDGNLFFVFFVDEKASGDVLARTIDATEIQDIITNPEDSDEPWFYRRVWTQRNFNPDTGAVSTVSREAYYPDIDYAPNVRQEFINTKPVMWGNPVIHRKCGAIAKWHFGCPLIYPALPWAKTSRRLLESIFTVKKSLAQFAMTLTTKGGIQAIQGAKQALGTNVGPNSANGIWDTNPTANDASIFSSGPGTKLEAFKTAGAGGNPEDVRRYIHWVCICFGIPETWMADASVGTVATAQSLDRPTELNFMEKQEAWREDLTKIAKFVLAASNKAVGGKLREAFSKQRVDQIHVVECPRSKKPNGEWVWEAASKPNTINVKVNFPAIREGDMPANVKAIVEAMTLDNKGGQIVGIDEKVGAGMLYAELGYENYEDILDQQYPKSKYDPDRTTALLPAPIGKVEPDPGGVPQDPGGKDPKPQDKKVAAAEAHMTPNQREELIVRFKEAIKRLRVA